MEQIYWIIFSIPIMIISATVHEYAHAWVAYKLGDDTAKAEGRLTLNPIAHLDPIGFLFMLFARIGWAKPVPVNIYNFENPLRGQFLVAVAGPVSNLILMVIGAALLKIVTIIIPDTTFISTLIIQFFVFFLFINATLAFFNLLPIPPLDGGNIVDALLPDRFRETWQSIGSFLPWIMLIFVLPISPFFAIFSNFWYNFIETIVFTLLQVFGI